MKTTKVTKHTKVYEKLVRGVRKIIPDRGVNVGIDEVIRLSEVSKMGMYQNFATKALLYSAVISEIQKDSLAILASAVEDAPKKPVGRGLRVAATTLCEMAAGGHVSNYEILTMIQVGMPQRTDEVHARANEVKSKVAEFLAGQAHLAGIAGNKVSSLVEDIMTITDGVTVRGLSTNRQEAYASGNALLLRLLAAAMEK